MPQKRIYVEGEVYFVTSRTFNNKKVFSNKVNCEILLKNIKYYRQRMKFKLLAYNILPDHLHLLILPKKRKDISKIMQLIKYRTASDIRKYLQHLRRREPGSRLPGDRGNENFTIWQKSFYDRIIRSDEEMYNTMQYINYNAVKHHLTDDPEKWPYSSYHNYCGNGKELIEIDYLE